MSDLFDLRCDPCDEKGLLAEIERRDKIIRSLMLQVERGLTSVENDYALLQSTYLLEEQVRERTHALKRSVEELEAFMAHAPVAIVITHDQMILRQNAKFGETFGFEGDEAIGKSIHCLFRSESEYEYASGLANPLLSNSQTFQAELFMRNQAGEDLWVNMIGYSLDSPGEIHRTIWMLEDRTAFKMAEEALLRSHEELEGRVSERTAELTEQLHFLQQLIEAIPGPVFYKDDQVRYLGCNHAFEAYIGMTAEELMGKTPHDIAPKDLADKYLAADLALLNNPGYQVYEAQVRYADGQMRHVMFHKATFTRPDGTVGGLVGLMLDITEQKKAAEKIEHLAYYDQLTDLPNRRLLLDRLEHATSMGARRKLHGALLLVDLDNFKTLNETQGYQGGDRLLQEVGRRLKSCVRSDDTVGRLGSDEFIVILEDLPGTEAAAVQAERAATKILHLLNQPYFLDDSHARGYYCSASIGVALFSDDSVPPEELLKRADLAMYQAKADHRNTLRFYDPGIQDRVMKRAAMEADLRTALKEQQFLLYYQPQVDATGRVVGAEALMRWQHPERGMVSPGEFIPLAEETGVILPLGLWALDQACAQLAAWAKEPLTESLLLAVNISARQFQQSDFVDQVIGAIEKYQVPRGRLKIELTESLLLNDAEDVIKKMSALKAHGVGFSLDDFGTGYSSLAYLRRLPLDQFKIDQSFVRNIVTNLNDAIIAKTVVALGQSLGMNVIAEGVETKEQRALLLSHGCSFYQGYFFSRPLPEAVFMEYLKAQRPLGEC